MSQPSSPGEPESRETPIGEVPWTNLETHDFDVVLKSELASIAERRQEIRRRQSTPEPVATNRRARRAPRTSASEANVPESLVGLALSGGGIRSGAFSLGVLAALKKTRVLDVVDYLSTVSGGGYAGAFWSSWALTSDESQTKQKIEFDGGQASSRLMTFIHSGNYLAQAANFFNRYIPGLVLILALTISGLIAGASGIAYLFREIDRPEYSDAVAALGFDGDILRALFPTVCLFGLWSLAWLTTYWKYGARSQGWLAGILFWPLMISLLASAGILLATGDIGFPVIETLMGATPDQRTIPNSFWYVLYSVVGASLLPYLRLPMLIRSGLSPHSVAEKYVFRIASTALLVGVPFVAFTWMAQENISGFLDRRGPEVVEADVFAGLQPDERHMVFDVMRQLAKLDERQECGGFDLRKQLTEHKSLKLSDDEVQAVLQLNARFVYRPAMPLKDLVQELSKLGLGAAKQKLVESLLGCSRRQMRDWADLEQRLERFSNSGDLRDVACRYLNDEIDNGADLREALRKAIGPSKDASQPISNEDELVLEVRSMFPPPVKVTPRQHALTEELQSILHDAHADQQTAMRDAAWKFSVLDDYDRQDLEEDLTHADSLDHMSRIRAVVRNYWPPRHGTVIDEWERLFARQAVLELPQPETALSRQGFAGAAVAKEKMSIPQRFRFFVSLLFHWGVTPLVEEEGSGIKHNPLHRIWSVRQRRRDVESELVTRLNGQILSNPDFYKSLLWPDVEMNREPICDLLNPTTSGETSRSSGRSDSRTAAANAVSAEAEAAAWAESRDKLIGQLPDSLQLPARPMAADASDHWVEWRKQPERSAAKLIEAVKDEEDLPESLTSQKAVQSVQREERRQKLILANRKLLETYIAQQATAATASQPGGAAAKSRSNTSRSVSLHSAGRVFGRTVMPHDQEFRAWVFWRAGLVFLILLFVIDLNSTSLHGFYRTRLAANWMESVPGVGRELPLAQLDTTARGQPYHLISTSLNLLGRHSKNPGDSRSDHFLLSQLHCGSERTGYVSTDRFAGGDYKLADAISISGAAVSPAQNTGILIRALLFLGNLRLGQWLPNPAFRSWSWTPRWFQSLRFWYYFTPGRFLLQSWQLAEERPFVFVSDGGHHENLGIGPLLQRRCRVILAFDAGADETYQFMDLANLVRWAELEHGVKISPLDQERIQELMPTKPLDRAAPATPSTATPVAGGTPTTAARSGDKPRLSEQHWIAARVNYPDGHSGLLVYLKANLTGKEPFDVLRFARTHDQFPHDTTVDQCYDSDQFAAYVQLGNHIANELSDVLRGQASPELNHRLWSKVGTPAEKNLFTR